MRRPPGPPATSAYCPPKHASVGNPPTPQRVVREELVAVLGRAGGVVVVYAGPFGVSGSVTGADPDADPRTISLPSATARRCAVKPSAISVSGGS